MAYDEAFNAAPYNTKKVSQDILRADVSLTFDCPEKIDRIDVDDFSIRLSYAGGIEIEGSHWPRLAVITLHEYRGELLEKMAEGIFGERIEIDENTLLFRNEENKMSHIVSYTPGHKYIYTANYDSHFIDDTDIIVAVTSIRERPLSKEGRRKTDAHPDGFEDMDIRLVHVESSRQIPTVKVSEDWKDKYSIEDIERDIDEPDIFYMKPGDSVRIETGGYEFDEMSCMVGYYDYGWGTYETMEVPITGNTVIPEFGYRLLSQDIEHPLIVMFHVYVEGIGSGSVRARLLPY